jgi:hypothetical protein
MRAHVVELIGPRARAASEGVHEHDWRATYTTVIDIQAAYRTR